MLPIDFCGSVMHKYHLDDSYVEGISMKMHSEKDEIKPLGF
jgi:hypothetical protein